MYANVWRGISVIHVSEAELEFNLDFLTSTAIVTACLCH